LKRGIHVDQFVDLQRQMAITRLIQGLFGSQHELILEACGLTFACRRDRPK
jgi:hypothetical protein